MQRVYSEELDGVQHARDAGRARVAAKIDNLLDAQNCPINDRATRLSASASDVTRELHSRQAESEKLTRQLQHEKVRLEQRIQTLRKPDGSGFDMAKYKNAVAAYKQAVFDSTIHLTMADNEGTLDHIRNMSPQHKDALLNLERELVQERLGEEVRHLEAGLNTRASECQKLAEQNAAIVAQVQSLLADKQTLEKNLAEQKASADLQVRRFTADKQTLEKDLAEQNAAVLAQVQSLLADKQTLEKNLAEQKASADLQVRRFTADKQTLEKDLAEQKASADLQVRRLTADKQTLEKDLAEQKASADLQVRRLTADKQGLEGDLAAARRRLELQEGEPSEKNSSTQKVRTHVDGRKQLESDIANKNQRPSTEHETSANVRVEVERLRLAVEASDKLLHKKDSDIALLLMSEAGEQQQSVETWLPLANALQGGYVAPSGALAEVTMAWVMVQAWAEGCRRIPTEPHGILNLVVRSYARAVTMTWDKGCGYGCLGVLARALEKAQSAPIGAVMELLRVMRVRFVRSTTAGENKRLAVQFAQFQAWQLARLVKARWPSAAGIDQAVKEHGEAVRHLSPDLVTIARLVADDGGQLRPAFTGGEQPADPLLGLPRQYCPRQDIGLLVTPREPFGVWAFDLTRRTVRLVDNELGYWASRTDYRLRGPDGEEDIAVPAATNGEMDFIDEHMPLRENLAPIEH
ncbi:hypothetical protein GGR56DRAFT_671182 [Xylariaceae sp. FL0804]|nr:hypothetical protein GGR56DRAFT_671182 [Xylariaceae sp. FL0804]